MATNAVQCLRALAPCVTIDLVEFRILGPFEVRVDGRTVPLAARKLRALLAVLLLHANEPLSRDRLIEDLWAGRPPATAPKILKTYVSQLRGALGRDAIETVPSGYELRAGPESVDARRFEQLVAEARVAAPPAAALALREALALWRGPPLAEFAYEPWARLEIARLEELRLEALEERIDAELALGGDSEVVAELELLVARHPLRERLRGQLMLALYRSGRQAEALAAYRDARRALVEALGIEPGPSLRRLERAVLDQDPSLDVGRSEQGADGRAQPPPRLRGPSSSFVGRKRELRELQTLLRREDVQLLTLTGAAGSGKTRLAIEAARGLAADWPQVVLVELAPIADSNLVEKTIADELGVRPRPGQTPGEALIDYLRDRRALLLLDNFEHVLAAAAPLRELIAAAPGVTMLVTSRAALGVARERIYPVPPLELPDPSMPRTLARLRETEAIRLFCDRAREARPDFGLCAANAEAVAEVCVCLDGLPLALELAAARTTLLSPHALVARMGGRLDLLKAVPGHGLAERHGTLRAAIEWSYDLLDTRSAGAVCQPRGLRGRVHARRRRGGRRQWRRRRARRRRVPAPKQPAHDPPRGRRRAARRDARDDPRVRPRAPATRGDGEDVRRRHAMFYATLAEEAEPALEGRTSSSGSNGSTRSATTSAPPWIGRGHPVTRSSASGSPRHSASSGISATTSGRPAGGLRSCLRSARPRPRPPPRRRRRSPRWPTSSAISRPSSACSR